jgi:hypothetical protein
MKFSLFKEYGALNSKPVFGAFEQSLLDRNHMVCESDMHCDVAVIWSVLWNGRMLGNKPVWDYYRKTNRPVIVLEVGGIQRGITWKVNLNGVNRAADYQPCNNDHTRSKQLDLLLKPWQTQGEYILVCGQHDRSLQWRNMPSVSNWFLSTYEIIRQHSDRPIIFRPHPRCQLDHIERGLKNVYRQVPGLVKNTYDDFDLAFDNVWTTVNWSSNPGIHSIIAGVPAIVGPDSLAYDVAEHDLSNIENPHCPDRTQWLNDYAWTEFTVEEIAQGIPIDLLTKLL